MSHHSVSTYQEPALEPGLSIVDAHHHMYPDDSPEGYSRADLGRDIVAGHHIVATVFIDCSAAYRPDGPSELAPVGETEWAMTTRHDGVASGIVSFADMYLGRDAGKVLDAHLAVGGDVFKGIRHSVAWDRDPHVNNAKRHAPEHALLDETFQSGVAELAWRNLVFETWCYFHQMGELADLARTFPDLRIVLDHLGGPVVIGPYAGHRAEMLEGWRRGVSELGTCPNVFFKLGGIGYPSFVEQSVLEGPRTSEVLAVYWAPEILHCIEVFGADRCMFESNYPADSPLCDYVTLWNVFKRVSEGLSASERAAVFERTARRAYSLGGS